MSVEHAFHQRRLGAREDVADRALVLDGRAQRVLDVAAVEGGDGLELVERDRQALLAGGGDSAGQREHFGRQPGGVARRPDRGEGDGDAGARRAAGRRSVTSGRTASSSSCVQRRIRPTGVSAVTSARA